MLLKSKKFVNASLWQPANTRCLPFPPLPNSFRRGKVVRELGEGHAVPLEHFILSFRRNGNRFCGGAGVLGVVRVEVPGAKLVQESALHSRQQYAGTCLDHPDGSFVYWLELGQ